MKIIPFNEKHVDELTQVDRSVFEHAWTEENFLRVMPTKRRLSKIARSGNNVVGYIIGSTYHGNGHIHRLAVKPAYQARGIGTHLVASFSKECLTLGLKNITAETPKKNVVADRFYKRRGFRELKGKALEQYLTQKRKQIRGDIVYSKRV